MASWSVLLAFLGWPRRVHEVPGVGSAITVSWGPALAELSGGTPAPQPGQRRLSTLTERHFCHTFNDYRPKARLVSDWRSHHRFTAPNAASKSSHPTGADLPNSQITIPPMTTT